MGTALTSLYRICYRLRVVLTSFKMINIQRLYAMTKLILWKSKSKKLYSKSPSYNRIFKTTSSSSAPLIQILRNSNPKLEAGNPWPKSAHIDSILGTEVYQPRIPPKIFDWFHTFGRNLDLRIFLIILKIKQL